MFQWRRSIELRPQKIRKFLPLPKKGGRRRLPVCQQSIVYKQDSPMKVQASNAKENQKSCTLLESAMHQHVSAIVKKETSDPLNWNLIVYGRSITHHHPMRNGVHSEIGEMSSSRHQIDSYPIHSQCPGLHPTLSESKGEAFHWVGVD